METTISNYKKQAQDFAKNHGLKMKILDEYYRPYFFQDKESRSVFKIRLTRNGKSYTFNFGQSLMNSGKEPEIYDILTCMTKCDPGTFENFCSEYGYDTDSRNAEKTYKAVMKEWEAMERLFGDVMEEFQEIN